MNKIRGLFNLFKKQPFLLKLFIIGTLFGYSWEFVSSFFVTKYPIESNVIENIFYKDIKRKELLGSLAGSRLTVDSTFGDLSDSVIFSGNIRGSKNSFNFNGLVVIIEEKWVVKKVNFQQIKKE
jgi:hypothetical protein